MEGLGWRLLCNGSCKLGWERKDTVRLHKDIVVSLREYIRLLFFFLSHNSIMLL